jgi:hypothetical protein
MYFEAFSRLSSPLVPFFSPDTASSIGEGGLLAYLLNGEYPQLASDLFFRPMLHSLVLKVRTLRSCTRQMAVIELLIGVPFLCGD